MEKIYATRSVSVSGAVHRFENGKPPKLATNIDAYMNSQRAAAMASGAGRSGSLDCISLIN